MEVLGNDVPRTVGKSHTSLLTGLQVTGIDGPGQVRQGFGRGTQGELGGTGAGAVTVGRSNAVHETEPLWVAAGIIAQDAGLPVLGARSCE